VSQDVKIGVSANTTGAANQLKDIERATDGVADAALNVAKATKAAADGMRQMEAIAQRLKHVQSILSGQLGKPVDAADAALFLHNFERMRNGRGIGSQRIRAFDTFESWYGGHSSTFKKAADADRHRRYVLGVGMQNTGFARSNGIPAFPAPHQPESPFTNPAKRVGSSVMSFGKGMLAIAGITSVMGMLGQAVDMATEEAVGLDTLKRRSGDLGVSFGQLQAQVRSTAEGMGLTFVEASRLANQLAKTTGNFDHGAGDLRTSIGFARSFGLEPGDTTQFFGTMRRLGVQGAGDNESRRLALMIADAIEKGGYTAKADEVLKAVADFSSQAARITLSTPNVETFASYLSGLTRTGIPGLDPAGAAGILGAADASVRRGGGMGEAGLNFSYAALMRGTRGLNNPVMAEALWEGGLFGTTAGVFGPGGALGAWAKAHGMPVPDLNGETNFSKMRGLMRSQYGNSPFYLDAVKNYFGLSSISQASALDMMSPADLTSSQALVEGAGLKLSDLSGSGIQGIAQISGARDWGDLMRVYGGVRSRGDLQDKDRAGLSDAFKSGDFDTLQKALVRFVGTHDQEQTDGSETRQTIADLKNELTRVGAELFDPINAIRNVVVGTSKVLRGDTGNGQIGSIMKLPGGDEGYLDPNSGQFIQIPTFGVTPMPSDVTAPGTAAGGRVSVGVTGEITLPVTDQNGNQRGTATLRPYVKRPPVGIDDVGRTGVW
jgi:hypothetical protein